MKKLVWLVSAAGTAVLLFAAQQDPDISVIVSKTQNRLTMAIVDFHASGDGQKLADAFNQTLWSDIDGSGLFNLASKSFYPARFPQQPSDLQAPPPPLNRPLRRGETPPPTSGGGLWMSDWSGSPVNATYLTFGYAAVQNGVFVARGFLLDLRRPTPTDAQVLGKNYLGSVDEAGARKAAHDFSCDIITQFGGKCIAGTHIYFTHQNTKLGPKEIWVMESDGSNQHAITHYNNIPGSNFTSVAPDGSKIAFVSYAKGQPGIFVYSTDPPRDLRFYNQVASVNGSPSFSPDGKQIIYNSSAPDDKCCRIFVANVNGTGFRPVSPPGEIDAEPKINPKNDKQIVFSSGRSGKEQLYTMDISGGNIERLTEGTGEASNPAWHPNGRTVAFAWTRGYMAGKFNIFLIDVVSHQYLQLTHDEGRNENPTWAPDGVHLAFMSTRGGSDQIYTMLADGTQATKLTSQGYNSNPAWGK
jgi:TolB protein